MLTRTFFSAISYNSEDFLKAKLDDLISRRVLTWWCFVFHYPEADELRSHRHILFLPDGTQDTSAIVCELEEYDPEHPDLPLKTMGVRHSQFASWYMYAQHDKDYLASIGDDPKKFTYNREAFVSSDPELFIEYIHTSDFSKWKKEAHFKECVRRGLNFDDLLVSGTFPIQQIYQYKKAYDVLISRYYPQGNSDCRVEVNGDIVDKYTGEVLGSVADMPFVFEDDL